MNGITEREHERNNGSNTHLKVVSWRSERAGVVCDTWCSLQYCNMWVTLTVLSSVNVSVEEIEREREQTEEKKEEGDREKNRPKRRLYC